MVDGIEACFTCSFRASAIECPVSGHASPFRDDRANPGEDVVMTSISQSRRSRCSEGAENRRIIAFAKEGKLEGTDEKQKAK